MRYRIKVSIVAALVLFALAMLGLIAFSMPQAKAGIGPNFAPIIQTYLRHNGYPKAKCTTIKLIYPLAYDKFECVTQ